MKGLAKGRRKAVITMILIGTVITNAGCSIKNDKSGKPASESRSNSLSCTKNLFAMDTAMTVTAYGEQSEEAAGAALLEIQRIEQLLSTGIEESEIARLNREGSGQVSNETADLINTSLDLYKATSGAFNIAIYPIMEEWGFTTGNYKVPEKKKLEQLLTLADADTVKIGNSNQITLETPGVKIDLGGIAKGFTSQRIMELFQQYDIKNGIVNLGGNVQVLGSKVDGSAWRIAIEDPEDTTTNLGVLQVMDKAVITSGGYERNFEQDGTTYHHIIDPSTGYPAENGLSSVTIVSSDGTLADGLSTSLFIMGEEDAITYWKENKETFDFILKNTEGTILVTEGIADDFTAESPVTVVNG